MGPAFCFVICCLWRLLFAAFSFRPIGVTQFLKLPMLIAVTTVAAMWQQSALRSRTARCDENLSIGVG